MAARKRNRQKSPIVKPSESLGTKLTNYLMVWNFVRSKEVQLPFSDKRKLFEELADKNSVLIKCFEEYLFNEEVIPSMVTIVVSGLYSNIFKFFNEFRETNFAQLAILEAIRNE